MKSKKEIEKLFNSGFKTLEKELNIRIRNGQANEGIKKTLAWVLDTEFTPKYIRDGGSRGPKKRFTSLQYLRGEHDIQNGAS